MTYQSRWVHKSSQERIETDYDVNSNLLCIFQQSDGTVKTKNSTLPEVASISRATTTLTAMEKSPTLEVSLQTQSSDRECQVTARTVRFPASPLMQDHDGVLLRHAPVDRSLQNYVSVAIHVRILYLSRNATLVVHPSKRRMNDTMRRHFFWGSTENDLQTYTQQ